MLLLHLLFWLPERVGCIGHSNPRVEGFDLRPWMGGGSFNDEDIVEDHVGNVKGWWRWEAVH